MHVIQSVLPSTFKGLCQEVYYFVCNLLILQNSDPLNLFYKLYSDFVTDLDFIDSEVMEMGECLSRPNGRDMY